MINCMFFNSNNIQHRHSDILDFCSEKKIDLAIIAETGLMNSGNPFQNVIVSLPPKSKIKKGGITVFSPSGLIRNCQIIQTNVLKQWIILKIDSLIIGCAYFSPSSDLENSLFVALEKVSNNWLLEVLLVGDFNSRHAPSTGDHSSNARGSKFFRMINHYPLSLVKPISGKFTTGTSTGRGITDLLFLSNGASKVISEFVIYENEHLNRSDHHPMT